MISNGCQCSIHGFRQYGRDWERCSLYPNPSTGERVLYGEFLMNAQGEDVLRYSTPLPIKSLEEENAELFAQFKRLPPAWKVTTGICRILSLP